MTLFKRGRLWWTGFYVDGERFQYPTGTTNRRQAELIEHKLREEANLRKYQIRIQDPTLTLQNLIDEFREKANPTRSHEGRLKYLSVFFGPMRVTALTRNTALEYRQARQIADGPLKDATLNRDIGVLR